MALIDTGNFLKVGQLKTHSFCQMVWLTRFRGYRVATTLHVPHRNFLGQVSTKKVWIVDPQGSKKQ